MPFLQRKKRRTRLGTHDQGLGTFLGRALFLKGKGAPWVEMFRPWIVPMVFSGAGAKYVGLPTHWAVALAVIIPVVIELVAVLIGHIEHRSGATEAHYQLAADTDIFKRESLERLAKIEGEVRAIRIAVVAIYRALPLRRPPAA